MALHKTLTGCWKIPGCCVALSIRHCGVRKVRLIPHDFARLASRHFWTACTKWLFQQPVKSPYRVLQTPRSELQT